MSRPPCSARRLLDDTASANPKFAGKTFALGNVYQNQIGYYKKSDIRSQLLHELGFKDNEFIAGLPDGDFDGPLSAEEADLLDADLLIFVGEPDTTAASLLKQFPSLATVPAVADGRMVLLTDLEVGMALSAALVLSIPIALEALVPQAAKVLA